MALTTRELLLLNNLMYMPNTPPMCDIDINNFGPDTTVGEIVDMILSNRDQFAHRDDSRELMTNQEWLDLLEAVQSDPHLRDVVLVTTYEDNGAEGSGGGQSALFVDPSNNEAIVVFQGTAAKEWKDDFLGGTRTHTSDGVSTMQQEHALEWYRSLALDKYSSITLTGHSKGGNKAKYITVLDDSVTRCVSFDGQGFSDDFMTHYSDRIAANQGKISNHNADYDYVNLILNDIGETHYYKGNNIGYGGFAENHCPNAHFSKENGVLTMTETPRPHEMEVMDEYLNSMLRAIPPEKREEYLATIGEAVEMALGAGDFEGAVEYLLRPENTECAGFILGYTTAYIRDHPEAADSIRSVLDRFGMGEFSAYVDTFEDVVNNPLFKHLVEPGGDLVEWVAKLPPWAFQWIKKQAAKHGVPVDKLTDEQLRALLMIVASGTGVVNHVDTHISGKDIVIPSASAGTARFSVCPGRLETACGKLHSSSARIAEISEELNAVLSQFSGLLRLLLYSKVVRRVETIQRQSATCEQLSTVLETCLNSYQNTELQVIDQF